MSTKVSEISSFSEDYAFLSNFYLCSLEWEGLVYPSLECAYQASKTLNQGAKAVFTGLSAREAKKQGRRLEIRQDWEFVKLAIMYKLISIKFGKVDDNWQLWNALYNTHPATLIEGNTWGDTFWGATWNYPEQKWEGQNWLGKCLMRWREFLVGDF